MCCFGVQRGSGDNKDCHCLDGSVGIVPVKRLSLMFLTQTWK